MDDYSITINLNKKRFTRLTFFFWLSIASLLAFFIFPIDTSSDDPQTLKLINFLTFIGSHFIFLIYISLLAGASGRSGILWWLGSAMFAPFSSIIGYYRMKVIAIKHGWENNI